MKQKKGRTQARGRGKEVTESKNKTSFGYKNLYVMLCSIWVHFFIPFRLCLPSLNKFFFFLSIYPVLSNATKLRLNNMHWPCMSE